MTLTPRDWAHIKRTQAHKVFGTPEATTLLADAKKFDALADEIAKLQDALAAIEHSRTQAHVYGEFQKYCDKQGFTREDIDGPLHELQGAFEAGACLALRPTTPQGDPT